MLINREKPMSSKNRKLVAILGGRPYMDCLTLRRFCTPLVRKNFSNAGIDFIIATNNPKAADQFEKISNLKVVRTSESLREEFSSRQREEKPNLGSETRETINQYAIDNGYELVLHLDDNITSIFYEENGKNRTIIKSKPLSFYEISMLLFRVMEETTMGALGMTMSSTPPGNGEQKITAGFPYSLNLKMPQKTTY